MLVSRWARYNDKGPSKRKAGDQREEKMLCHCLWRWKKEPQAKECRQPLAARKGKEVDSRLESLERPQPCGHTHFRLLTSRAVRY